MIAELEIWDRHKVGLPVNHFKGVTKLSDKLKIAEWGKVFKTSFNRNKTMFTLAQMDYDDGIISLNRKFDALDELLVSAVYSFQRSVIEREKTADIYKEGLVMFTARQVLQHIFGNVPDHFQIETVQEIDRRLYSLSFMKLSFNLKDNLGNDVYLQRGSERYHPIAIRDSLLDLTSVDMQSLKTKKKVTVYKLNRQSPLFDYAEWLDQITSWPTDYLAVPCRKTLQNAVISNYLLTRIALVRNAGNRYVNNGILFDTIYGDLNLDVSTREKKRLIRDDIEAMFYYWVEIGLLKSYEFVKSGQKFHKIEFKLNKRVVEIC